VRASRAAGGRLQGGGQEEIRCGGSEQYVDKSKKQRGSSNAREGTTQKLETRGNKGESLRRT